MYTMKIQRILTGLSNKNFQNTTLLFIQTCRKFCCTLIHSLRFGKYIKNSNRIKMELKNKSVFRNPDI